MRFVGFEDFQPLFEQRLHLCVFDVRYEDVTDQRVDRLVIGEFVFGIGLVKRGTAEGTELCDNGVAVLIQFLAQKVVFRLSAQLFQQREP